MIMRKKLQYIKSLWSPFKPFRIKWYFGKTAIGTPYFLPRRTVKLTKEEAYEKVLKDTQNKSLVHFGKNPEELAIKYEGYSKFVTKKIGFDITSLGWKTKWDDKDFRFEWEPNFSFVFFGFQIAAIIVAPEQEHNWEAWLYYELKTDHKNTKKERITQCKKEFPLRYKIYRNQTEPESVDYYDLILREKYK